MAKSDLAAGAGARERRGEEEEEFRRKNLPTFNFAMLLHSCIVLVGLLASPPQRRFRHVAGILSFLLFLKSSLAVARTQLDPGWFNLFSRKSYMIHVASSLLQLGIIASLLTLHSVWEFTK